MYYKNLSMKTMIKKLGTTLLILMLLSVSYATKAYDKTNFVIETEDALSLEAWMTDDAVWELQDQVKKTPMLAITPEGDTIQVFIEDVVKAKDTVNIYNEYNTYNTYNNYDGWLFYYNDAWIISSVWYHNYYHVYYPIVRHDIYHSPEQIKRYYQKHNIKFVDVKVKHQKYYRQPINPYRSHYNRNTDFEKYRRGYNVVNNNNHIQRNNYEPRRNTGTRPQYTKPNPPQKQQMQPQNRGGRSQGQGRR